MVAHDDNFSRGIAMVLQGESMKASCYVTHNASLGTLREKMVSNFVRHETPERYRVETGLIRHHDKDLTSRQCDLLIHEPAFETPLYRWEDFVIVQAKAARAVIEVKSELNKDNFNTLIENHASIKNIEMTQGGLFVPTFGYGLNGVTFDTFISYIQDALATNRLGTPDTQKMLNVPFCITVQGRHYLGVQPLMFEVGGTDAFCIMDFSKATDERAKPVDGIETGFFLQIYSEVLRSRQTAFQASQVYEWFNALPIADDGKVWVTPDGAVHKGNIA